MHAFNFISFMLNAVEEGKIGCENLLFSALYVEFILLERMENTNSSSY